MKFRFAVGFILLTLVMFVPARGQAPTMQQCRADAALWGREANYEPSLKALGYEELFARVNEMRSCTIMTNKPSQAIDYMGLEYVYQTEMINRMTHFISRHGLSHEFHVEDDQGKR